jgi:hypothetical protein
MRFSARIHQRLLAVEVEQGRFGVDGHRTGPSAASPAIPSVLILPIRRGDRFT